MNRLRILFAFVMGALWLPATQHCGLQAAGLIAASHCAQEDGSHGCGLGSDCATDGCETLESGKYRSDTGALKVASPHLVITACLIRLHVAEPALAACPLLRPPPAERAQEWVPQWHFVRRAAAPAHAPDSLIA